MITGYLFYMLAFLLILFSLGVLMHSSPLFSSLNLVGSMIVLSAMYYLLQVPFIAAVQLIVYAGAVMVLFVMVMMMFDLKHEIKIFSGGFISNAIKCGLAGFFAFTIGATAFMSTEMISGSAKVKTEVLSVKSMAQLLFKDYLIEFEVLGVILLLVAVGAVALSRIKGGTHAS